MSYEPRQSRYNAISLKDLIRSFLLEVSPDAVKHLNEFTRRAEDIYSERIPKIDKRSTKTNTIERKRMRFNWGLSSLNNLLTTKILRIIKK